MVNHLAEGELDIIRELNADAFDGADGDDLGILFDDEWAIEQEALWQQINAAASDDARRELEGRWLERTSAYLVATVPDDGPSIEDLAYDMWVEDQG